MTDLHKVRNKIYGETCGAVRIVIYNETCIATCIEINNGLWSVTLAEGQVATDEIVDELE